MPTQAAWLACDVSQGANEALSKQDKFELDRNPIGAFTLHWLGFSELEGGRYARLSRVIFHDVKRGIRMLGI